MLSRTSLSLRFLPEAAERTTCNELWSFWYSLASKSSKHSLIVWASLLKGPSCISYKKLRQNWGRLSFMPMRVASEATRCRMMFRDTSSRANDVYYRLMLTQVENFSTSASFLPSTSSSSSSSISSPFSIACPFLNMRPLMIKKMCSKCYSYFFIVFTPKA